MGEWVIVFHFYIYILAQLCPITRLLTVPGYPVIAWEYAKCFPMNGHNSWISVKSTLTWTLLPDSSLVSGLKTQERCDTRARHWKYVLVVWDHTLYRQKQFPKLVLILVLLIQALNTTQNNIYLHIWFSYCRVRISFSRKTFYPHTY